MARVSGLAALCMAWAWAGAAAHESKPGYLDLRETAGGHYETLWKQPARGELRLPIQPIFPPHCVAGSEVRTDTKAGAWVARGSLICEPNLAGSELAIEGLETTGTEVLVRVHHADGRSETHLLRNVSPSVVLGQAMTGAQRARAYLWVGIEHILLGVDHLLFVLGLLLIVRDRWMLIKTVTSFTIAHSLTLAIATLGYASAPIGPLNAAIALSILFLGPEIVRVWRGETSLTIRHPWVVAFAFGLLHGFGFASGLTEMGLPPAEIPLALLLFNLGVEIGQLFFVLLILAVERSWDVLEMNWPRWAQLLPGYAVGTLGAFWTMQRVAILLGPI